MVTDQEPRYRLVDSNGNVVGTLFAEADGTLKLQEGTSGNDNEVSLSTNGTLGVKQMNVKLAAGGYHFAGAYDGTDPNARLSNAESAAATGDVIYVENDTYTSDRTLGQHHYVGGFGGAGAGKHAVIGSGATWTVGEFHTQLFGFSVAGEIVVSNGFASRIQNCNLTTDSVSVNGSNKVMITNCSDGSVTFDSSASGGLVDACVGVGVTDNNGGNTIGDIA